MKTSSVNPYVATNYTATKKNNSPAFGKLNEVVKEIRDGFAKGNDRIYDINRLPLGNQIKNKALTAEDADAFVELAIKPESPKVIVQMSAIILDAFASYKIVPSAQKLKELEDATPAILKKLAPTPKPPEPKLTGFKGFLKRMFP
ncbi:MAG TPA: hypothetical protein P5556_01170 [Candidatus Gastranaerophilales bacterium]|nr:hypothetical protein [Candidatus Gastranaerophilales bacterium]